MSERILNSSRSSSRNRSISRLNHNIEEEEDKQSEWYSIIISHELFERLKYSSRYGITESYEEIITRHFDFYEKHNGARYHYDNED